MSQAIDEAIRKTMGAVETIAPKAWEMAVRAQRVDAAVGLAQGAAIAAAFLTVFGLVWWAAGGLFPEDLDAEDRLWMRMAAAVILAIVLFIDTVNAAGNVAQYVAPDLYAVKSLTRVSQ